jgi:hypothetical protein
VKVERWKVKKVKRWEVKKLKESLESEGEAMESEETERITGK